ncbi:MAG: class I SAM-dependent methyltransferase [Crocosphaera sp.]
MINSTLNDTKTQAINLAKEVDGYMTERELKWLYDNANNQSVEIGSYKGRSTTAIGLKLKQSQGNLTCVDCWHNEDIYNDFKNNIKQAEIPLSMLKMRSVEAASHIPDNSLDFVFIDSSHEYQDTIEEILLWLPKLKSDGLLCGHDYGNPYFPGLKEAVEELCFGFENPVDSIWTLKVREITPESMTLFKKLTNYQNQLLSLQKQFYESENSKNQTLQESQNYQNQIVALQQQINEKEIEKNQILQTYQQEKQQLSEEVAAMKTSKFWKLRSLWFNVKKILGLPIK